MNVLHLAKRNIKEMIREPLGSVFCIGFPVFMLLLMQIIFTNIDLEVVPPSFEIKNYASGICIFGYAFLTLFIALQLASDKNSSFIKRINIAPISKAEYYLSYVVSSLPIALGQTVLFYLISLIFKYPFDGYFFLGIVYLLPSALLYICFGILIGCICSDEKQTGPIGSIFVSLTSIIGGVFMPVSMFKGGFKTFIDLLPFIHTSEIASELHTKGASCIYPHILFILGYIVVITAIIILVEKLKSLKK